MKFMTFVIGLVIVAFTGSAAFSGNGHPSDPAPVFRTTLSGVVTDKVSSEKLAGVTIQLISTGQKIYTDTKGEFSFEGIEPGTYKVKIQCISYKDREVSVEVKPAVKGKKLQILLNQVEP